MPTDQQILVAGTSAAPLTYTVPNAIEAALLCVNATIDGTSASGSFLPTVEIISDGGVVVARCPCFTTIVAGASAEVSWFRLRQTPTLSATSSQYSTTVLATPDVKSYWRLDETSGALWSDSGPSNNPMGVHGNPVLGAPPLINAGHSAVFLGTTDGVGRALQYGQTGVGYGTWPGDGSLSVEAWINTQFSGSTNPQILCMDDNNFRLFQFRLQASGFLEFITFKTGGATSIGLDSTVAVNDGVRHHVVGTWNGTSLAAKVYIDGALNNSGVGTGSYAPTTPKANLASRLVGGINNTPIGGTLDEVALYSRELSAAEVLQHYTVGIA